VVPPFSRFYIGGEMDVRGFDIRTVSPVAFYPTTVSVCNRDNAGNQILAVDSNGRPTGACGSSTSFPINSPTFPGGDTEVIANFEYRVPIAGPVTLAYFVDAGSTFVLWQNQLKLTTNALSSIASQFPYFPIPSELKPIGVTNFHPRSSTGLDLQVILPVLNAPIHIFYGYNWLRLNSVITPPQNLPPESLFPNPATYLDALQNFIPFRLRERKGRVGFTVERTF
jgi:outer membrane protein insertion porin family